MRTYLARPLSLVCFMGLATPGSGYYRNFLRRCGLGTIQQADCVRCERYTRNGVHAPGAIPLPIPTPTPPPSHPIPSHPIPSPPSPNVLRALPAAAAGERWVRRAGEAIEASGHVRIARVQALPPSHRPSVCQSRTQKAQLCSAPICDSGYSTTGVSTLSMAGLLS